MNATTDIPAPRIDRGCLAALPPTLEWGGGCDGLLRILDQTQLPARVETRTCATAEAVWEAIRSLRVRGAPAIGVAAAYGLCLGARPFRTLAPAAFLPVAEESGLIVELDLWAVAAACWAEFFGAGTRNFGRASSAAIASRSSAISPASV